MKAFLESNNFREIDLKKDFIRVFHNERNNIFLIDLRSHWIMGRPIKDREELKYSYLRFHEQILDSGKSGSTNNTPLPPKFFQQSKLRMLL